MAGEHVGERDNEGLAWEASEGSKYSFQGQL